MLSSENKFWIYLIILIPSILSTIFVLYYLLFDRTLRRHIHNHNITILLVLGLISQLINYPWMLQYYRLNQQWERSLIFCTIWAFFDWTIYITQTLVFAWTTIERHILIFHSKWISTKRQRFLIHYLPLIFLLHYCFIFHIIIYFFPPCQNLLFEFDMICVYFCLNSHYKLYMWQTITHQIIPNLIIVCFSIALLIRFVHFKNRIHQPIRWKKYRKMTIQLLSISLLYLLFSFPFILVTLMYLSGWINQMFTTILLYADIFSYFIILCFPFVCMSSLPNLHLKIKRIFSTMNCHRARIRPRA